MGWGGVWTRDISMSKHKMNSCVKWSASGRNLTKDGPIISPLVVASLKLLEGRPAKQQRARLSSSKVISKSSHLQFFGRYNASFYKGIW